MLSRVMRAVLVLPIIGAAQLDASEVRSAAEPHWSLLPIERPAAPAVSDAAWPWHDIDRFVLARLERHGLAPVADASAQALLRRVRFDLTGLPPTVQEQDEFLHEPTREKFTRLVDQLLASHEFGERWGQHWLDVARFAESSGGGRSLMLPEAWRYRDYVIESLNADKPFDRFIIEQVAGDLLPSITDAQYDEQHIATGFLLLGPINYEAQDKELLEMEVVDEQLDTVGRAFLGMTLGCARCHDHEFDPIPTADYYGLAGFFTSTHSVVHANVGAPRTVTLKNDSGTEAYRKHQKRLKKIQKELQEVQQGLEVATTADPRGEEGVAQLDALKAAVESQAKRVKEFESQTPREPKAMSVADIDKPGDTHILIRGVVRNRGPVTQRCFLTAACESNDAVHSVPELGPTESGRLQLARWIASAENPLTTRVLVNRVWHHLFGVGLVRTTDNFGTMGEQPSHPELLDYLASDLASSGWSLKSLVRRIVLSRTYQLASECSETASSVDPENRLLSHAHLRRLDAEALRDSLLATSGQLDPERGGLTIHKLSTYDSNYQFQTSRRSVYVPRFRNSQLGLFAAFDSATPNVVAGRRNVSILPTQALLMMNSPFLTQVAERAAVRLLSAAESADDRIYRFYRLALGRSPTEPERELAKRYLARMRSRDDVTSEAQAWSGWCQLVFCSLDFRYLN